MNGQGKIGTRELEILEYLQENKEASYSEVVAKFSSPTERTDVIEDRIYRMKDKGYITIEQGDYGSLVVRLAW